ncbi:MAG TPA: DNA polymerase Y family protein, partial [Lacipirellula sp.]
MQRVLAIWLPNWPLQRLLAARPELRGQPLVLEAPSRRGQAVAACSAEAANAGVQLGMPTAEAITILTHAHNSNPTPTLPRIPLFPYDPFADRKALAQLAQWCHRYSPTTGFEEAEAPETLLLDATNLAPLYGSEELLVAQVTQGFRRLGLEVRIALAGAIGAAWAMAHYGATQSPIKATGSAGGRLSETPRLPQSLSTGKAGGFYGIADTLAPLPIAALRLDANLLETLANLGAEQIGDLLSLPREQLRSRFGPQLLTRIDQALGATREVFVAVDPPEEFVVEQLFEYPVSNRESLHHVIETLLARLVWMLAARSAGALRVACRFDGEGAPPTEIEVGLFQPTANPRHLLEIIDLEFERLRLRAPATAVTIRALRHAPLAERQQVLFDGERNLDSSRPLAALVDRLSSRLGETAVLRCRLQHDAQPERAYKKDPLVQNPPPPKVAEGPRRRGARGGIKKMTNSRMTNDERLSAGSSHSSFPSLSFSSQRRGATALAPL